MTGSDAPKRPLRLAVTTALASDARLTRRASKRDERAFAAIFDRYHREIYRFCLSILGNPEDAGEALQNTMVRALQALPGEKRQIRLKPWLYRVAHNESIDLVRKRRETAAMDPEFAAPGEDLAEAVTQRERLRQLLLDLADLPERQRAALAMRELGGLGFAQIAEALDTSPAVARQTVYEARLNLHSLEEGREMSCEEVMHRLSNVDGRVSRRRDLQAHLRACSDCRAFREAIDARQRDFAALAPLPAGAAASILHAILGSASEATGGAVGAGGAAVASGAGKAVGIGFAAKSAATVAVVTAIGVSAADRGGLIHTGLPGGSGGAAPAKQVGGTGEAQASPASAGAQLPSGAPSSSGLAPDAVAAGEKSRGHAGDSNTTARSSPGSQATAGRGEGSAESLPPASQRGQETAAAHRHGAAAGHDQGHGHPHSSSPASQPSHRKPHRGHAKSKGGSSHPHAAPSPPHKREPDQPPPEDTPEPEQSSGSATKGAKSRSATEGMP